MKKEGLGESAEFYAYHPIVNFTYFLLVIAVSMFSSHPVFLVLSMIGSWAYEGLLNGMNSYKYNFRILILMGGIMVLINMLSVHDGDTVLFYLNQNRITVEAGIYGFATALMLANVIVWFRSFQVIMTGDKFIYLFGRLAPTLALLLSMVFRYIPLFKQRFREISNGQQCMGRGLEGESIFKRIHQMMKEVSILIAWSLESSIETSDSMEARGYGLSGRTSYHLYRFTKRDAEALIAILFSGGIAIAGTCLGTTSMYYYPEIHIPWGSGWYILTALGYTALMIIPVVIDIRGERRWKQLNFEI